VPIYEFSCLSCRQTFDVFGGYASRDERQICPACESTNTKAMFSTFAVVGTGEASSVRPRLAARAAAAAPVRIERKQLDTSLGYPA